MPKVPDQKFSNFTSENCEKRAENSFAGGVRSRSNQRALPRPGRRTAVVRPATGCNSSCDSACRKSRECREAMPWRVRQRVRSQRENRWRGSYQFPTVDSVIIPCALMVRLRCIRGTKIVHATQNLRIPRSGCRYDLRDSALRLRTRRLSDLAAFLVALQQTT